MTETKNTLLYLQRSVQPLKVENQTTRSMSLTLFQIFTMEINDIVTDWMCWMAGSGSGRFQSDAHSGTPTAHDVRPLSRELNGMLR